MLKITVIMEWNKKSPSTLRIARLSNLREGAEEKERERENKGGGERGSERNFSHALWLQERVREGGGEGGGLGLWGLSGGMIEGVTLGFSPSPAPSIE